MIRPRLWMLALCVAVALAAISCGKAGGGFTSAGDDASDDDLGDDAAGDDDAGGDPWDIWIAPWPQAAVPPRDYDEGPAPGPLRLKAQAYDAWHEAHHQPFYGSTVEVYFKDDERTEPIWYGGLGDSCIWTGTYLASQAFRYYVTGEAQARANVLRAQSALSGHLHVTGRPGFIARYRGPQDPVLMPADCAQQDNCHVVTEGPYAGDFWFGDTSRDQYTGWFLGMAMAYDLVDDEATRDQIRADVTEVLEELIRTGFVITDVDGRRTGPGPEVIPTYRLAWYLIGYHITGQGNFKRVVQDLIRDENRTALKVSAVSFMNRYTQEYGNNLGHQNAYDMLRLARAYLNDNDTQFLLDLFETQTHRYLRLEHNAFFNAIEMSQGRYEAAPGDPYEAQLLEDLTDFRPAPNSEYAVTPPEAELDPVSVFLYDLFQKYPTLEGIFGSTQVQALHAYPVFYQCFTDFLWQRNPFSIECGGVDEPRYVSPGVDYLVAYWMAAYHKFLGKAD